MTAAHWAVILAIAGGLGLQLSGLEHWADATNPKFVAGVLIQVSGSVAALFTKQAGKQIWSEEERQAIRDAKKE